MGTDFLIRSRFIRNNSIYKIFSRFFTHRNYSF